MKEKLGHSLHRRAINQFSTPVSITIRNSRWIAELQTTIIIHNNEITRVTIWCIAVVDPRAAWNYLTK